MTKISEKMFSYVDITDSEDKYLFIGVITLILSGHVITTGYEQYLMGETTFGITLIGIGLLQFIPYILNEITNINTKFIFAIFTLVLGTIFLLLQQFGLGALLYMISVFWYNSDSKIYNTSLLEVFSHGQD